MTAETINIALQIGISLLLLGVALFTGRRIEVRHLKRLDRREQELAHIQYTDLRTCPENWTVTDSFLVTGSVVIATDYFKTFAASIRNLFGGRMRSLETLVERGRREAIVRMLEHADGLAAQAVWNVRVETSSIQGKRQGSFGGIELVAYGTALRLLES